MSQHEKLVRRLKAEPSDFAWTELKALLSGFGYVEAKGKGSRRKFKCDGRDVIILHEPHPRRTLPNYAVRQLILKLKDEDLI